MHLFYLNVTKHMRNHWRGNFFPWEMQGGAKKAHAKQTTESYCVAPHHWNEIANDMTSSAKAFPTVFGDPPRYEMAVAQYASKRHACCS